MPSTLGYDLFALFRLAFHENFSLTKLKMLPGKGF